MNDGMAVFVTLHLMPLLLLVVIREASRCCRTVTLVLRSWKK